MSAPTIFSTQVRQVREAGLEPSDIATATGADATTVSSWMSSRRSPTGSRRIRLIDLVAVVERASAVMDPRYVPIWLNKPVQSLDDERPIERIRVGDSRAVLRLLARLENDSFS